MALARRVLAVLIAAAVAFAPVGASASAHAPQAKPHPAHAMHHSRGAMAMAGTAAIAKHCEAKAARTCCCDDKGACAQTCLMKCFGQLAVIAPDRSARAHAPLRFAALSAEPPPDWSSAPQPPPPRA